MRPWPLHAPPPQELLQQEANVTHVKAPVVVVGDTHGQFHDLLEIFKIAGGWGTHCNCSFEGPRAAWP